jgi:hypothetical protein
VDFVRKNAQNPLLLLFIFGGIEKQKAAPEEQAMPSVFQYCRLRSEI